MVLPPDLASATVDVTTSPTANTVTTGTILGTPGAGLRYRAWGFGAVPFSTGQAVANWYMGLQLGGAGPRVIAVSGANYAAPLPVWLPGGLVTTANVSLVWEARSALASALFRVWVYYTTEQIV